MGLWAPVYLLAGATAVANDFLMAAMFIMLTLAVLGAYVTEFPIFATLYQNEIAHKTAISSLLGMAGGMILGLGYAGFVSGDEEVTGVITTQGKMLATWAAMSIPAYPLMVFLVSKVNKRDLEAENKIREEKKKKRRESGGGPPIMKRDGF